MTEINLAQKIKHQFETECRLPFPLGDIRKLRARDAKNLTLLHARLEMYLSYIAGYASSTDRLGRRPRTELVRARENLSQSFFEKFSSLTAYRDAVTPEFTPDLFRELATADKIRKELIIVMDDILSQSLG